MPDEMEEIERIWRIRLRVEIDKRGGITAESRYEGDAYADRIFLLNEIDSMRETLAKALSLIG